MTMIYDYTLMEDDYMTQEKSSSWIAVLAVSMCMVLVVFAFTLTRPAYAEPMTKEQGDDILKELKDIHTLLEKQQRPQAPQQPQQPPKPEKIKIKGGGPYSLGKNDAPVVIIEYTDYQCPYCGRFETTTFPEIKKNFIDTGKVKFIKRDVPLEFHQFALKAAQSARCAGEQSKFWEMNEVLFKNQTKLDADSLAGYAKDLKINVDKFKTCTSGDKFISDIKDEAKYAATFGITGTPSFIVGRAVGDDVDGFKVVGAQPYAVFEAQINELLGAAGKK